MPADRRRHSRDELIRSALAHAKRLARWTEGVHAIDYGYAYVNGVRTERASVRFHVKRKRLPDELARSHLLPKEIHGIAVDVIESGYRLHAGDPRAQQPTLSPGISIGNLATSETGTLGALVRGSAGETLILSNWHVLAGGAAAAIGDEIVQPGPMHLGPAAARAVATLDRSLALTEQFDAALGRMIDGIPVSPEVFDVGFEPRSVADPILGSRLIKSGAVSGVTEAIIDGVSGSYQLDYSNFGLGMCWMRGFRLVKDPANSSASISEPGDSGSLWIDAQSQTAVGLHFGGEDDASALNNYALAHSLSEVLQRLNVQLVL